MAGRPKKYSTGIESKSRGKRKSYNKKKAEERGITYSEPRLITSFWTTYSMDQVMSMSDEEIMQAIDKFLEGFIYRQKKLNKAWDFPVHPKMLAIDPNWQK